MSEKSKLPQMMGVTAQYDARYFMSMIKVELIKMMQKLTEPLSEQL